MREKRTTMTRKVDRMCVLTSQDTAKKAWNKVK